ncbi:hypothetical protein EV180_001747 [Coemansia sp. RSA 518]|nr:hypothetical protein GGH16_002574 [Coemansia sp. RSA 560]KAJ2181331.1 hypothetical protein EV181_005251 [Coemansia sp. RSA 532]KAJ2185666.1 hypothetical protein GGH18_004333 [Coemansia sp. RSA 530]KAJ2191795.1 hypothetical protein IW144_005175 [Coemansia sp. RSA 522]KAJ2228926.1 hypothetical protein EV180_001747 [Coemansia sp. RSA 518]KAJ2241507.1 hypothetical protein GGH97_004260 [Coemansia sp. RSA 475]KAJ2253493.1 hypothetical protein GGH98_002637 [Coemansia sp. RSA 454]KAJ2284407.1 hyp
MKVAGIASILALAVATQAAPALHVVTKYAEPTTVTVYQNADGSIFSSPPSFFGGSRPHHSRPSRPRPTYDSSSAEESTSDDSSFADESTLDEVESSAPSVTEELSTAESDITESVSEPEPSTTDSGSGSGSGSITGGWITEMVCAINKVRASHGASPLGISDELNSIAQKHSDYQNSINQMTHDDPAGGVGARLTALGVSWMSAAENVAAGMTTPAQAQQALEESPGHLANMVDSSMTFVGVGRSSNYYTQNFYGNGASTPAINIPQCN